MGLDNSPLDALAVATICSQLVLHTECRSSTAKTGWCCGVRAHRAGHLLILLQGLPDLDERPQLVSCWSISKFTQHLVPVDARKHGLHLCRHDSLCPPGRLPMCEESVIIVFVFVAGCFVIGFARASGGSVVCRTNWLRNAILWSWNVDSFVFQGKLDLWKQLNDRVELLD